MDKSSPYYKSHYPKHSLELLQWAIMEPSRVRKLEEDMTIKEMIIPLLKAYFIFSIILILVVFLLQGVIVFFDLPSQISIYYEEEFNNNWVLKTTLFEKWKFLFIYPFYGLVFGLTLGLTLGLVGVGVGGLSRGLAMGLLAGSSVGFTIGFSYGFSGDLASGLIFGMVSGMLVGLVFELLIELPGELGFRMTFGLAFGLVLGLMYGLIDNLALSGLTFILSFYIFYFRIPWLFFYTLKPKINFLNNPILKDESIWILPFTLKNKLIQLVQKNPKKGRHLVEFLIKERPLQRKFSYELTHVHIGTYWKNNPISLEGLTSLKDIQDEKYKQFEPSKKWHKLLLEAHNYLLNAQQQTNPRLKLNRIKALSKTWQELKAQTYLEFSIWNKYYFEGIDKWELAIKEQLEILEKAAEDIVYNPYKVGDPLDPENHKAVFVGREDLRAELGLNLRASDVMPLFLIQGQRRVGKTSLLNFLQGMLGERFKIIHQDLQSAADCKDVPSWMNNIRKRANQLFEIQEKKEWSASDDWLTAWEELSSYLSQLSSNQEFKIIIAIDEYEALHEKGLMHHPVQAAHLLGAMRSFCQHQKQVVFLFVGAALFNELEHPNWGDYFVNAVRIKVGYLSKENTIQLISNPYPEYSIRLAEELPEKIYDLTKGHPALVQVIGFEIVEFSNKNNQTSISMDDLDWIINEKVLDENQGALAVFWGQFCRDKCMKDAVRNIILQQPEIDRDCRIKLYRHEFIEKENDQYKMRVPLFEQWVRKFDIDL